MYARSTIAAGGVKLLPENLPLDHAVVVYAPHRGLVFFIAHDTIRGALPIPSCLIRET